VNWRDWDGSEVACLVIRRYAGDAQPHLYWADQIDNPAYEYLLPVAHEWPYPARHPRDMLSHWDEPAPGALCDDCPTCVRWSARNRHSILIRGLVPESHVP
jgi:hypothetical protein